MGSGALRRGARPPEDQVDQRPVREDGAGSAVPVLRQHRGRRPRAGRRAGRALRRGDLRRRRAVRPVRWASPARTCPAASPPSTSSAGTTRTRTSRRWRPTCRRGRAVVVGNGNVALDVARILVTDPDVLATTDIADHALKVLHDRGVEEVLVIGRRGPLQAPFTTLELRELGASRGPRRRRRDRRPGRLRRHHRRGPRGRGQDRPQQHQGVARVRRRGTARAPSAASCSGSARRRSRSRATARSSRSCWAATNWSPTTTAGSSAKDTGEREEVPAQLVVRAVGYRGVPTPGLPFDDKQRHHPARQRPGRGQPQ